MLLHKKYTFDSDQNKHTKKDGSVLRGEMLLLLLIYSSIKRCFSIIESCLTWEE